MSVISAKQAEQLNQQVRDRIDSRLFLTCNYAPTEVSSFSSDAKLFLGIQDLYKFAVDTSCIISYLWKYMPSGPDGGLKERIRNQVDDIKDLRAIISHSQSIDGGFFARQHLQRYDIIIRAVLNKARDNTEAKTKLMPEDNKDFDLLYTDLKDRATRLLENLKLFIDWVAKSDQRGDIVMRWTQDILDWYSRKQDIYLGQLGDVYQAKMAQKQGTTRASQFTNRSKSAIELREFQMRRKLNSWIENALFVDLDRQIDSCDWIIFNTKNVKHIKMAEDKRKEHLQTRKEREREIGENYRNYFFNNLRQQLETTMENYSGGLLPQELLQADIKRVFENVSSEDF